ncbi:MAG: hypothetical protein ACRCYU_11210, partial [Nocardioides sp.]
MSSWFGQRRREVASGAVMRCHRPMRGGGWIRGVLAMVFAVVALGWSSVSAASAAEPCSCAEPNPANDLAVYAERVPVV